MPQLEGLNQIKYINRWLRWLVAIFLGIVMVYISEPDSWLTVHLYEGYLKAILISCLVAVGISKLINYLNIWLDRKMSWLVRPVARVCIQFFFGLLLPIALTLTIYWYYFMRNGFEFDQTTYFTRVFYPFCLLLILANAYYPLHFYIQVNQFIAARKRKKELAQALLIANSAAEAAANLRIKKLAQQELNLANVAQIDAIALIISINRVVYWYGNTEEKLFWKHTIAQSDHLLPSADFYRVSKSCIVARANIVYAMHYKSKRVALKLALPEGSYITVSQRNTTDFNNWYQLGNLPNDGNELTILNE